MPSFWWPLVAALLGTLFALLILSFFPMPRYRYRLDTRHSFFGYVCLVALALLLGFFIGGNVGFSFLATDMYAPLTGVFGGGIGGILGLLVSIIVSIAVAHNRR